MTETDLARQLEELFRETGEAHHQAYIETDGADPEWPLWYADYLRERIGSLLDANFTQSELVYLLIWVANEQPLRAPAANWARYYAQVLYRSIHINLRPAWRSSGCHSQLEGASWRVVLPLAPW